MTWTIFKSVVLWQIIEWIGYTYHKTWKQPNRALSYHNFLVAAVCCNQNEVLWLHAKDLLFFLFLTAILHRGLRNDFFFHFFSTNLLFPISIWTFIPLFSLDFFPLFYLDFYFLSLFGFFFRFAVIFWISSKFFYVLTYNFIRQHKNFVKM